MEEIAGIILAAGRSSRMGHFKPLLPFGNSTVIDSCISHLRAGEVGPIVVVLGHRAADLREHLGNSEVLFAVNQDSSGEMSSSIACGVMEVPEKAKAVVITPVDHPAVPAEVISALIGEWRKGHQLVKPTWAGTGGHPVLVDLGFREKLLRLGSRLGLKGLFDANLERVKRVPVESRYVACDMDTWDDYANLHQDVFGVLPPPQSVALGVEGESN